MSIYFYIYIPTEEMTINIFDHDVELKLKMRAYVLYENITGKDPTHIETLSDVLVLFYCIVVSCDKDLHIKFDDFLDYIDEHPEAMPQFTSWLTGEYDYNDQLTNAEEEVEDVNKEVTTGGPKK